MRLGRIPAEADGAVDPLAVVDRRDLVERRQLPPVFAEQLRRVDRLEALRLDVDDVDLARGVAQDLVLGDVDAQPRLAGGDENRVVVADAVDGARAEARHQAHEPVVALDARRPAELVVAERDAGVRRQEVGADARAHHLLDHDPHLLVEVEQVALGAVLDRIGAEQRRVDLGNRVHQRAQPLALGADVGQEEALVLAGEGGAHPVLEQARAADDQRPAFEVVEGQRQPLHDLRREPRVLEHLDDVRILAANLLDLEVLPVVDVLELVVLDEAHEAVGRDVPRLRHLDAGQQIGVLAAPADDLRGQQHPGALAAQLPVARGRADDVVHQLVEVADLDVVLRGVDELEVLGEEPPRQRHPQADLHRPRQFLVLHRELVIALERLPDVGERGALVLDGLHEEARLVVLDPGLDAADDLALAQVRGGDAERVLGQRQQLLHALAPQRDVVLEPLGLRREIGGEPLQQLLRLVDAVPAQVVQHPARDPHQQVLIGLPQELDDDPPLAPLRRREVLHRRLPVAERGLQPALHHEVAQALGDRVDELPLLLEERPLVGAGHLAGVEDLERPHVLALRRDAGAQHPWGLGHVRRLVDRVVERDARPADARVLPAGWHHLRQRPADLVDRGVLLVDQLVDLVEGVQLLRALLELLDDVVDRLVGRGHGCDGACLHRMAPCPWRPSTAISSGAVRRTWRTNAVSVTAGCRERPSQSIGKSPWKGTEK